MRDNIAFIFPGQGSQYIGMGKDFYENSASSKKIYDIASEVVGLDIRKLCFEENDDINITEYTQIAMLTTSVALMSAVMDKGITPSAAGGLSLGEYGALVAAKVMSFENACKVVRKRGIYMQDEIPTGKGAMAAIIGLEAEKIADVIGNKKDLVGIANYNCPGQIVISGETEAVKSMETPLKEAGAKRVIMLNVSGPFHSSMLKGAGEKLGRELESIDIKPMAIPYVANVTGAFVKSESEVKALLEKQVYSSVKWQQCFETMIDYGIDTFLEIGPGKTLSGFARKINKEVKVINIDKFEDVEKLDELL